MCQAREEFSDSVKRAKLVIENQYERKLDCAKPAGAIVALKNMGWSDRQEVEFKGSLANLDVSRLPDWAVERLAAGESPISVLASATPELRAEALGLPAASSGETGNDGAGSG